MFIPSRFIDSKRHLPWITGARKREICKRDHLFQKFKSSNRDLDKGQYLMIIRDNFC